MMSDYSQVQTRDLEIIEAAMNVHLAEIDREIAEIEDDVYEGYFVDEFSYEEALKGQWEAENVFFDVSDELDARYEDFYFDEYFGEDDEFDLWGLDEIDEWDEEEELIDAQ